ncbi:MAG: hypothetical protein ACM3N0_12990 [Chloroflexota bacterium]
MKRSAIGTAALCATALFAGALFASLGLAESSVKEGVKVSVTGRLRPAVLPRRGRVPVKVRIGGKISAADPAKLRKLTKLTISINRNGRLDTHGLPRCRLRRIKPSTNREALAACRSALVGEGRFSADVRFPEQSPFPSNGKVLAFNGILHGRPAIFAHIYGTRPVPTSYVLPFAVKRRRRGTFGTILEASFPRVTGEWGYVTGLTMSLHRRFSYRGRTHGYLSAGCPAPKGFTKVPFLLAQTDFEFEGDLEITNPLRQTCTVRD